MDVALLDTALSLVAYQLTATLRTGDAPGRFGTAFPLIAPYEVFATADGELMIAAANDRLFAELCERIGLPGLADDPALRDQPGPRSRIARSCCRRSAPGSPSGRRPTGCGSSRGSRSRRCRTWPQVAQHEQVRAVGMIGEVDGVETVGVPLQIDGERLGHDAGAADARARTRRRCSPSSATPRPRSRRSSPRA